MTPDVETQLSIARPKPEIFEAIVNPDHMANYFVTSGSGRLDGDEPVTWYWADHGDAKLVVTAREIVPPDKIVFSWGATGKETIVTIELVENEKGEVDVKVRDAGLPPGEESFAIALQQMQGWANMLCCLKAYLEFGINLRAGVRVEEQ